MRFHYLSFFIAALVALVAKAAERKSILFLLTLAHWTFLTTCSCMGLAGYTDYIMALKKPVEDGVIEQAKSDVEAVGGKVVYEIKIGFQALIVSLPNDQYTTFENKDYVDFIEQDQQGKNKEGEDDDG